MIWLWERENEQLSCEVQKAEEADAYDLTITRPDGTEERQRFEDPSSLLQHASGWREWLSKKGWRPIRPW
jgi:hypothetical protein